MTEATPTSSPTSPALEVTLPVPPRAITAAARRQARREVAVRRWLLVAACVALVMVTVGWRNIRDGLADRALRRNGLRVEALVESIAGTMDRNVDRGSARPVVLSFTLPGESERRTVHGTSSAQAGRFSAREPISIWVNPTDVNQWTDRETPAAWPSLLAVPLVLAPIVALLGLLAGRRSRQFLNVYREGTLVRGTVSDVQTSPLAPGQKVLRVTLPDRAVRVTHPNRLGTIERGASVDVLTGPRGDAILSSAYA